MSDKYEYKKILDLPEGVLKTLHDNNACKRACKKLVEEAISHYERADIVEDEMWKQIFKTYNLDLKNMEYRIEDDALFGRTKTEGLVTKFFDEIQFRELVGKKFADILRDVK